MRISTYLAGAFLVAQHATCSPVTESIDLLRYLYRSLPKDQVSDSKKSDGRTVECRQEFKTDVWTGCDDVLAQFQLTLEEFILANPTIGEECDGFVPGETYCVAFNVPRNVTEDGICGQKINFTKTCVGSDFGDCCGLDGKCGSGEEFCGDNCQDGNCFGGTTTTSSIPAKPSATKAPLSVSTNGDCAYNSGFTCKGSEFGDCCSAAGYCGDDEYHCDKYLGCQPGFGNCT
ncbi:hypothetical protein FLAG1_08927 [Fusarium langsethiae]|uniref:Chitin-binding type-1 domain-containing protein n=1 Tax=Fusarium langsethiae TaxID=179993 RepID=A0A0N0V5P8_FUSLA|nr:hypothetical protein FLAG1_08927 [Fusarium langsethiae]GKU10105.1 unnamed protein product [Fusarium langsethiae]